MASQRLEVLLISDVDDEQVGRSYCLGTHSNETGTYEQIRVHSIMTVITRLMPRALSGCARSRLVKRTMMRPEGW